jgi:hypothetical protein
MVCVGCARRLVLSISEKHDGPEEKTALQMEGRFLKTSVCLKKEKPYRTLEKEMLITMKIAEIIHHCIFSGP